MRWVLRQGVAKVAKSVDGDGDGGARRMAGRLAVIKECDESVDMHKLTCGDHGCEQARYSAHDGSGARVRGVGN